MFEKKLFKIASSSAASSSTASKKSVLKLRNPLRQNVKSSQRHEPNHVKKFKLLQVKQEKRDQTNSNQFTLFNYPDPIIVSDDIVIEPFNPVLTKTKWLSDAHLDFVIDLWARICSWYSHCQILSLLKIMELQRHNIFLYQTLRQQIYFVYANRNDWYILTKIDNECIQEDHENRENDWFIYDSLGFFQTDS